MGDVEEFLVSDLDAKFIRFWHYVHHGSSAQDRVHSIVVHKSTNVSSVHFENIAHRLWIQYSTVLV